MKILMDRHASSRLGRVLHAAERVIGSAHAEVVGLHAIEREGEKGETPFIALLGLFFVLLLPVFLVMLGLALIGYYLA